ncbi:cell envelope integrity protein TolA [Aidingimonas lacisalsi]|uniref:cell envelope integrity protein TolA n=1 Tax=Aidingimonas lacisalsi TaxID=2604086 RepID=UPI0011D22CDD|nr:cell envelope integrity protein TolA [Aidingimonas lacisalsi]
MARHDKRVGYGLPTMLAVGLHVLVIIISMISLPSSTSDPTEASVVQATLVRTETTTDQALRNEDASGGTESSDEEPEEQQTQAEEAEQEPAEENTPEPADNTEQQAAERETTAQEREEARQAALAEAERRQQEAERLAQQREEEQRRLEEAERQREEEQQRREEAEAERRRQEEEQRRQEEAEAERQRQEEQRRQEEAEAERQRQEEEQRRQEEAEAERQRQEEQRRREEAEAERQRQEDAAQRAAEAASGSLDRAIAGEQDAIAQARQADEAANSFQNLVKRYVEQAWNVPPEADSGTVALVRLRLLPTGELVEANVIQRSGSDSFDRSVVRAVERAAPFREMQDLPPGAQRRFREFNLRFSPGEVR